METATDYSDQIKRICLDAFQEETCGVYALTDRLMDMEGLPMHCPPHHFILPAALLTVCHRQAGSDRGRLEQDLSEAKVRSSKVLGGFCGNYGTCGAAVGIGIFLSIYTKTTPLSTASWSQVNRATGLGLLKIAKVEGPRCCKRNLYLALDSAIDTVQEVLGLKLERPERVVCKYFPNNKECKGLKCPFFPKPA